MTQHEEFPGGYEIAPAAIETVFLDDEGTLNEAFLANTFGLGAEEALQVVSFGSYTGTVAQMLADEACPVPGMLKSAYAEKGIDGVVEKLQTLSTLDPNFSVQVSETTRQREDLKKNSSPDEVIVKPQIERIETTSEAAFRQKITKDIQSPKTPEVKSVKSHYEPSLRDRVLIAEDILHRANEESKTNKVEPATSVVRQSVPKAERPNKDVVSLAEEKEKPLPKLKPESAPVAKQKIVKPKSIPPSLPKKAEMLAPKSATTIEKPANPNVEIVVSVLPKIQESVEPLLAEMLDVVPAEPAIFEAAEDPELLATDLDVGLEADFDLAEDTSESSVLTIQEAEDVLFETEPEPTPTIYDVLSEIIHAELIEADPDREDSPARPVETFFSEYLETLEPARAEEVKGIMEVLGNDLKFLALDLELTDDEREAIEVEVYQLAARLFEVLGLENDKEKIKQFIETVRFESLTEKPAADELSVDYLNGKGTQEYKSDISNHLATRLTKLKIPAHQFLARYILQMALA